MIIRWADPAHTVLTVTRDDGHVYIVEEGHEEWGDLSQADGVIDYTPPPQEEVNAKLTAQARQARRAAFEREADPLFFKWQAGEGDEADWLAAREAIRARYPYPE